MKLLLDEMLPRALAEQLRSRGHDVLAVTEDQSLRGLPDKELLEAAYGQERAVVTYNRDDYLLIDADLRAREAPHADIVIVNSARFPEGVPATLGRLVRSLDSLLADPPPWPSFVHWLQ